MKSIEEIRRADSELAQIIEERCGFITSEDVSKLRKINRLMPVLVRCGAGRFTCPVQDLDHFITIIDEHAKMKSAATNQPMAGDYVRDVSLPV